MLNWHLIFPQEVRDRSSSFQKMSGHCCCCCCCCCCFCQIIKVFDAKWNLNHNIDHKFCQLQFNLVVHFSSKNKHLFVCEGNTDFRKQVVKLRYRCNHVLNSTILTCTSSSPDNIKRFSLFQNEKKRKNEFHFVCW